MGDKDSIILAVVFSLFLKGGGAWHPKVTKTERGKTATFLCPGSQATDF